MLAEAVTIAGMMTASLGSSDGDFCISIDERVSLTFSG